MADDVAKWDLYFNPKHFIIYDANGQFWIRPKVQGGQPEKLVDFIKKKDPLV